MTRAQDLTGIRFGQLLVVAPGPRIKFGRIQPGWICLCNCGTFELIANSRLPSTPAKLDGSASGEVRNIVTACTACRHSRTCTVCGANFHSEKKRVTCSENCDEIKRREEWRTQYHERSDRTPGLSQMRYEALKRRIESNPDVANMVRATQLRAQERRAARLSATPGLRQEKNDRARQAYQERAAEIQAKRRARLDEMSPPALLEWIERTRKYGTLYRQKWRAELRLDPERHDAYKSTMREYYRQRRRQQELLKMARISEELIKRMKS